MRGAANPLDGRHVHLTDAFLRQHHSNHTVGALLTSQACLLRAAMRVASAREPADVVFAADAEVAGYVGRSGPSGGPTTVLTWESFLDRLVPGHARKFLRRKERKRPLDSLAVS